MGQTLPVSISKVSFGASSSAGLTPSVLSRTPLTLCVDRASFSSDFNHFTNQAMTKLFIILMVALATINLVLGAPASYSPSIR